MSSIRSVYLNSNLSVSNRVIQLLESKGCEIAFGIPGGAMASLFNDLNNSQQIKTILCQHEGSAAYMAAGYSLTNPNLRIPILFATSGPGITNLITGIATAWTEGVPLFVLTGNVGLATEGKFAAQDSFPQGIDCEKLLAPVVLKTQILRSAENLDSIFEELWQLMEKNRLPVHLNIPRDTAMSQCKSENKNEATHEL